MIIQFNTDNNITGNDELRSPLTELISDKLKRYANTVSTVEVHLTDENGPKDGLNDKRCLLEVHLEGRNPVVVTNHGDTHELAVRGAIDKLKASLDTIIGRMSDH